MRIRGVRQHDASDCGAACLVSVAAFYGRHIGITQVRQWSGTDKSGTTLFGLMQAAKQLGLHAAALRYPGRRFPDLEGPFIAHLVLDSGLTHYVVGIRQKKDHVVVMDPARGECVEMSITSFQRQWSGVILELYPTTAFHTNSKKSLFNHLIAVVQPHSRVLVAAFGCSLLVTAIVLLLPVYLQQVVDTVWDQRDSELLALLSTAMILLVIVQGTLGWLKSEMVLVASQKIDVSLVLGYWKHILKLPATFFDTMEKGEIISRVNDAMKTNVFINRVALEFIIDVLTIVFSMIIMMTYNIHLALVVLLLVPVYVVIYLKTDKTHRVWQRRTLTCASAVDGVIVETLDLAGTIKHVAAEKFAFARMESSFTALVKTSATSSRKQIGYEVAAEAITRLLTIVLLWYGCTLLFQGNITKGELLSFFSLAAYFTSPAMTLMHAGRQIREMLIACERLFAITDLETEDEWHGPAGVALNKKMNGQALSAESINVSALELCAVSFRFPNGLEVLSGLNLTIPGDCITGITGDVGTGKSTLAKLLQKIYSPSEGRILLNGEDIADISVGELRRIVGMVPQQAALFNASIRDNVCLDRPYDEEWFHNVGERVGIMNLCRSLPDGTDTMIGERGIALSGGQKQQVAIARAMYTKCAVLILDEPTSSLDGMLEKQVMQTIEWYKNLGNTVIIITHSDTALKICNNIVVLKK